MRSYARNPRIAARKSAKKHKPVEVSLPAMARVIPFRDMLSPKIVQAPGGPTPESKEFTDQHGNMWIPVSMIDPNPDQPRIDFPEKDLKELAGSIRKNGQIEAAIITPKGYRNPNRYMLIAGERRFHALKYLGFSHMKVSISVPRNDDDLLLQALLDNQRSELSPIEEARSCARLLSSSLYRASASTQEEKIKLIAKDLARPNKWVEDRLNLLKLPEEVQERMSNKTPEPDRLALALGVYLAKEVSGASGQKHLASMAVSQEWNLGRLKNYAQANEYVTAESKSKNAGSKPGKKHKRVLGVKQLLSLLERQTADLEPLRAMDDDKLKKIFASTNSVERKDLSTMSKDIAAFYMRIQRLVEKL